MQFSADGLVAGMQKEAEGKFAAWHESSVRNTNRLHGNPME